MQFIQFSSEISPGMSTPFFFFNSNFAVKSMNSHTKLDKYRLEITSCQLMLDFAINEIYAKFRGKN